MKYLFYIALIIGLSACEKQLTIQIDDFEKQLVVNALASNKTPFTLNLSENAPILEEPQYRTGIYKGRLVIFEDDFLIFDKEVNIDSGLLVTSNFMQAGKTYEVLLDVDDYPVVNAVDVMPDADPEFDLRQLQAMGENYQLEVELRDNEGDDYYMILMYVVGRQAVGNDTVTAEKTLNFYSSDKLFISNINTIRANNHFAFFDDALLNGGSKMVDLQFAKSETLIKDGFVPKQIKVEVRSLSPKFFEYNIHLLENNHIYGGPLASASYFDGNIIGGLGFFGCYTSDSKIKTLP